VNTTRIFGRDEDLHRLDRFISDISRGPCALSLEGDPGIGKTILWNAGVQRARERGYRVLHARPGAAERELSFAVLGDVLADVHDEVGFLPAPQRRALRVALLLEDVRGQPPELRAVGAALRGLLLHLAGRGPVLVAIDDAQWADPPSAAALRFALRRLDSSPVGMLSAQRRDGAHARIDGEGRVDLGPLGVNELDQLLRSRLGARFLRPTLLQLEEASGGNPFYALEIGAGLLRAEGDLQPGQPLPIPGSLRDVVRDRLALLSTPAREAALVTAALARPTVQILERLMVDAASGVAEAVDHGVLDRNRESVRLTHPLLGATLYEDLPAAERRALHARLADVAVDAEERAHHLAEAAEGPNEELACLLDSAAAEAATRGASDTAARLARRALDLTPVDSRPDVHARTLDLARHTLAAGDPVLAETILEDRLQAAEPGVERAEIELELGRTRRATLGEIAARGSLERALHAIDGKEALALRTTILVELAEVLLYDAPTGSETSTRSVAFAEELGDPELLAHALGIHGITQVLAGQPPSDEYWDRALEVESTTGALRYGGPSNTYSVAAFMRGDFELSNALANRVAASMRERSDPMLPSVLLGLSEHARIFGAWEEAAAFAQEAYDLVVQTGRESQEPDCLLFKARIALPRGELELASRDAEAALALVEHWEASDAIRLQVEATATAVLGGVMFITSRYGEAHEYFLRAIEAAEQVGPLFAHFLAEVFAGDMESLLALGELEEASRQLDRCVEVAATFEAPTLDGVVALARGLHASAEGEFGSALRHLERARGVFESLEPPWLFLLARTLLALGSTQRRARQKLPARTSLERALQIFEQLGATLWAEMARTELGQIGGRPSRPGLLTATEQRVADLVASGRSNAEVAHELFMSPKTVEWNLSKIYKKLHVRSRAELAAKFAKKTAVTP
jgi:DNA-binding CsgD family transcriptional regulator